MGEVSKGPPLDEEGLLREKELVFSREEPLIDHPKQSALNTYIDEQNEMNLAGYTDTLYIHIRILHTYIYYTDKYIFYTYKFRDHEFEKE